MDFEFQYNRCFGGMKYKL